MYNRVGIMGRFAQAPELRYAQNGAAMVTFTLAVDRDYKDKDSGERTTDWIDCIAWRKTGEFVHRYFTKGRMALVEGRIQVRNWTDKDGNKRKSTEVVVDEIYFADSPPAKRTGADSCPAVPPQQPAYHEIPDDDGELPF